MATSTLLQESLTRSVIGAFFEVYNTLGYGFLERLYSMAMERELRERGHCVERELSVIVSYKGFPLARQRLDMVVDDLLVVEIKSTHELPRGAQRQLFNYLHATTLDLGLLLHFGPEAKFHRVIASTSAASSVKIR
ncbi:MAG: GxxExxY protein [Gemmatimonadaceae bacterium]|nr:GxxExxY protein [Geodermatophilaceae bacterium]MBA3672091.1 GxxExxY protein [Gemmatimonadaceae bacterium]